MLKSDIAPFFPKVDHLEIVYSIFDKDENGDVSLEEIEMACLEVSFCERFSRLKLADCIESCMQIHRERQSLASSMRDLDSAVVSLADVLNASHTSGSSHGSILPRRDSIKYSCHSGTSCPA